MRIRVMIDLVKAEIERYPKGQRQSPQNCFRMIYWLYRMNSLGNKAAIPPTAEAALAAAMRAVRETDPGWADFTPTLA